MADKLEFGVYRGSAGKTVNVDRGSVGETVNMDRGSETCTPHVDHASVGQTLNANREIGGDIIKLEHEAVVSDTDSDTVILSLNEQKRNRTMTEKGLYYGLEIKYKERDRLFKMLNTKTNGRVLDEIEVAESNNKQITKNLNSPNDYLTNLDIRRPTSNMNPMANIFHPVPGVPSPKPIDKAGGYVMKNEGSGCVVRDGSSEERENLRQDEGLCSEVMLAVVRELRKPPSDIKVFDGNPMEYRRFVRQFETRIIHNCDTDDERLNYLDQYTSGKVNKIVAGYCHLDARYGYPAVRRELEERYGDSDVIANAYVQKALNWQNIKPDDARALDEFAIYITECENAVSSVEAVKVLEYAENMRRLVSKLPYYLHDRWRNVALATRDRNGIVKFENLVEFVRKEAKKAMDPTYGRDAMVHRGADVKGVPSKFEKYSRPRGSFATDVTVMKGSGMKMKEAGGSPNVRTVAYGAGPVKMCLSCNSSCHSLDACKRFEMMKHEEKIQFLRFKGLCFGCLKGGHQRKFCRGMSSCARCQGKHPTILHIERNVEQKTIAMEPKSATDVKAVGQNPMNACAKLRERFGDHMGAGEGEVTMAIIPVMVKSKNGNMTKTYAFLDPGSSITFATDGLVKRLGMKGCDVKITLDTMGTPHTMNTSIVSGLLLSDLQCNSTIVLPRVYTKDKMPVSRRHIPTQDNISKWPHLQDVKLPEIESDVELLIGNGVADAYTPLKVITGPASSPHAEKTGLGWVVWNVVRDMSSIGSDSDECGFTANRVEVLAIEEAEELQQLDKLVRASINLEFSEQTIDDRRENSIEDVKFTEKVSRSIEYNDGHYVVGLPFRDENVHMPNNYSLALKRLQNLEKRLRSDVRFQEHYSTFMNDIVKKGYAEKVPIDELDRSDHRVWYIPHHGVYHPKKPDKIRIVFDCSARFGGVSLNGMLLQGPDLTNSLIDVLLRFRQKPVAMMADIEAMFHQVDDCLKSADSAEDAIALFHGLRDACKRGDFNLTKWVTNSGEVLEAIPEEDRAKGVKHLDLDQDQMLTERVLGVCWEIESDVLGFKIAIRDRPSTRRGLLYVVSSIYDPLGIAAPFTLPAKCIMQELCHRGVGWDEPIEGDDLRKWLQWLHDLPHLKKLTVPRCLRPAEFETVTSCQIHNFSDASESGYGVVSYLRLTSEGGDVNCSLMMGKSRVTPLKKVTIPRLELTAATLAVRVNRMLIRELDYKVDDSFFWTDSMSVLRYIENDTTRFHTFVANRLNVIREGSEVSRWCYVNTKINPADDASRGLQTSDVNRAERWVNGPEFLWKPECEWPHRPNSMLTVLAEDDPEVRQKVNGCLVAEETPVLGKLVSDVSKWLKLKRIVGWILLFMQKLKRWVSRRKEIRDRIVEVGSSGVDQDKEADAGIHKLKLELIGEKAEIMPIELTVDVLQSAEYVICFCVQREYFAKEIDELSKSPESRSKVGLRKCGPMYKLDPVLKNGIIRVGGRLERANMVYDMKHLIVLPRDSPVSRLILDDIHRASGHMGRTVMLSELQQKFWVVHASALIKSILRKCVTCRRYRSQVGEQKMADLPADRLVPDEAPFNRTGMDYFGPIEVRRGRSSVKRYGVIFTCLASRAIHLEVAASLDTDSCINAIRRFISRRGQVSVMRSDNGTNLVGAEKELREELSKLNTVKVHELLAQQSVRWEFNPPAGSHFGGVWERQIRTVRKVLYGLLREHPTRLDDEGLHTMFCEVEAIVNGRPITTVSADPADLEPLTPNHLLLLRAKTSLPPGVFASHDVYARRRWRQVQYLADVFWRRWVKEYLPSLQVRQKWLQPHRNVEQGDVVVIKDGSALRSCWQLGKVIDVHRDSKNFVRSAKVRTATGVLVRPVDKMLVILEA